MRNTIARSGDPHFFPAVHVPLSTAREWSKVGVKEVVSHPSLGMPNWELISENDRLTRELAAEKAKNNLVSFSLQIVGFQMQYLRVNAGSIPFVVEATAAGSPRGTGAMPFTGPVILPKTLANSNNIKRDCDN